MKIKTVHFDDEGQPVAVVAEMTIEESAWIAVLAGKDTEDVSTGLYHGLTKGVFNPHWSDGVDGYLRGETE